MNAKFNEIDKKKLVKTITRLTGSEAKYLGAPTFGYEIGAYTVNRDGSVEGEPLEMGILIEMLGHEGIRQETTNLSISLPKTKFTDETMANLISIVAAKQELLKKALGTDDLSIIQEGDEVTFPWFTGTSIDETNAYMLFLVKMTEFAKNHKRITMKAKETENEKYAFRCFLLRLGFIGDEYKAARKVLLKNLTGSAAFRSGSRQEVAE